MNDITTFIATTVTTGVHVRPSAYILPALVTIGIIVVVIRKTRDSGETESYINPYSTDQENTLKNVGNDNSTSDSAEAVNTESAGGAQESADNAENVDNVGNVGNPEEK